MTIGRSFDPRNPYAVETLGGLWDDVVDSVGSAASGVQAYFSPPQDPAFSDPDLYARSMQAYQVRNAIDTGVAAKATGAKVGSPSKKSTTTTPVATVVKAAVTEGTPYATIGGAAAVLGAGAAYATGHKQAALGLGVVGLAALAYGWFGSSR